jgi:hypothetical protein
MGAGTVSSKLACKKCGLAQRNKRNGRFVSLLVGMIWPREVVNDQCINPQRF